MTATYNPSQLDDPKNQVRLLLSDTDTNDAYLHDEEITFFLDNNSNVYLAAADAAEALYAQHVGEYDTITADGVTISSQQVAERFQGLAKHYRQRGRLLGQAQVYVGGRSKSEAKMEREDEDLIQMHIQSHIHDNPESHGGEDNPVVHKW